MIQRMQHKLTAVLLIIALTVSMLPGMAQEVWADPGGAEMSLRTIGTHVFNSVTEGYGTQPFHQETIDNTGDGGTGELTIELGGANPEAFTLSKTSITNIEANKSDYFNITPKTGLTANTYTATVTVSGPGVTAKSFDVSFLVSPAGATYTATIRTYIDDTSSDVTGKVELWKNGSLAAEAEKTETGGYTEIHIGDDDTGISVGINGGPNSNAVNYYTVNFSSITAGTADASSVTATANGSSISSGTLVLKNASVIFTAKGKGAASYTYGWNDAGSTTTATLSIAFLKTPVNVACTVAGVGEPPAEPDYDINGDGYLWTGNSEKIVLSGDNDILNQKMDRRSRSMEIQLPSMR
ncbi:MAG: hypothetical protein K0R19_2059 [Bacillota bacterium]|nr:hypothetical protein [Bacillota bacterium]